MSAKNFLPVGYEIAGGEATGGDILKAAFEEAKYISNTNAAQTAKEEAYDTRITAIAEATGVRLANPLRHGGQAARRRAARRGETFEEPEARFVRRLQELALEQPDHVDVIQPERDPLEDAYDLARTAQKNFDAAFNSREGFGRWAAAFAGGMAGSLRDPVQVGTLFLGAGPSAARTAIGRVASIAGREALINAGVETALQPAQFGWSKQAGLEYGLEDAARNVAFAAGFGGVLGGAGRGAFEVVDALVTDRAFARDLRPEGVHPDEHEARFEEATAAAEQPELLQKVMQRGAPEDFGRNSAAGLEAYVPTLDPPQRKDGSAGIHIFRPEDLQVDAKRFQFREQGDAQGVTSKLKSINRWLPERANQLVVWEDKAGGLWVVDGHQRSGLARRLMAEGQEQNIELPAVLYREKHGVSAEEAFKKATLKNIAEGSADPIDAAKVLRTGTADDLADLSISDTRINQSTDLAKLDDEPWRMVINRIVPANYARFVGQIIDDAQRQLAAMKELARRPPRNELEAQLTVQQVNEAALMAEVDASQGDMFGLGVESTAGEEVAIVAAAIKQVRSDRSLFKRTANSAERLEQGGTQVDVDAATEVVSEAEIVALTLEKLAFKAGFVREKLRDLAMELKRGRQNQARSAGELIEHVRSRTQGGMGEREIHALLAGRDQQADGGARQAPERSAREQEVLAPVQAAPEAGSLDELALMLENGAPFQDIESHPAVLKSKEAAEAIAQTAHAKGFMSDAWQSNRFFTFSDGQVVKGVDAAIERHYLDAQRLGWTDANLTPPTNSTKFDRKIVVVIGPPAAGKSTFANALARKYGAAIVDSDEIKKTLPEYQGGLGAMAVHEESSMLSAFLLDRAMEDGANIILPKVGDNAAKIKKLIADLSAENYQVDLVHVKVEAETAYKRMLGRFIKTGRLLSPEYLRQVGNKPDATFGALKGDPNVKRYAQIDNTASLEAGARVTQEKDGLLAGTGIGDDQGRGRFSGSFESTAGAQKAALEFGAEAEASLFDAPRDAPLQTETLARTQDDDLEAEFVFAGVDDALEVKPLKDALEDARKGHDVADVVDACKPWRTR